MLSELVSNWGAGWAISRGTPEPVTVPWGLYIEVGAPGQVGRHVLPEATEAAVRAATASVTVPDTWLKVCLEDAEVERWLPAGWYADREDAGHLMATDLRTTHPVTPDGYATSVEQRAGVTYVRVHDAAGTLAAKGQMAVLGDATVVDRVETHPAHRRRGLGSVVMRALADRAVAEGARLGILGATDEGRALYESLDWKRHAPLAACVYRP